MASIQEQLRDGRAPRHDIAKAAADRIDALEAALREIRDHDGTGSVMRWIWAMQKIAREALASGPATKEACPICVERDHPELFVCDTCGRTGMSSGPAAKEEA